MTPASPLLRCPSKPFGALAALLLLTHCGTADEPAPGAGAAGSGGSSALAGSSGTAGSGVATGGSAVTGGSGGSVNGGSGNAGASGAGGSTGGGTSGGSGGGSAGGGAGGSAQGGSAGQPPGDTIPMTIPTPSNGQGEIRNDTTVLKNAKNGGKDVWDFGNQRIGVQSSACEGGEGQTTVFEVEDGVTVRNLIIAGGSAGGNGIVCKGNCTLEYVYWEDVCEDAATNAKDGATMTLNHVIALHATDKVFQHNAKGGSKTIIRNSYISDFGKLWRSCGDCEDNGGPRHLIIENVRVDGVKTAVAGANRNYGDTVSIKDLYVKGGYKSGQDTPRICTEYNGVTDHIGESTSIDGGKSQWGTATCKVAQSDVKPY